MPVQSCRKNEKPGFRWGKRGYCYTYEPGDMNSKKRAKEQAAKQGRAIKANQGD